MFSFLLWPCELCTSLFCSSVLLFFFFLLLSSSFFFFVGSAIVSHRLHEMFMVRSLLSLYQFSLINPPPRLSCLSCFPLCEVLLPLPFALSCQYHCFFCLNIHFPFVLLTSSCCCYRVLPLSTIFLNLFRDKMSERCFLRAISSVPSLAPFLYFLNYLSLYDLRRPS